MRREYAPQHAALVAKFAPAATAPPPAGAAGIDIDFPCGSDLETVYVDLAPGAFYGSLAAVCVHPVWRSELVRLGIPPHLRAAVCEVGLFDLLADCWAEAGGGNYPLPVRIGEATETGRWVRAVLPTDPNQSRPWVAALEALFAVPAPITAAMVAAPVPAPAPMPASAPASGSQQPASRLSPDFLQNHRKRLDAIGPWREEFNAGANLLSLVWDQPAALSDCAFPYPLWFILDSTNRSFDPDERVFELWTDYLEHHAEMRAVLIADDASSATLLLTRDAARRSPPAHPYSMQLVFHIEGNSDDEPCAEYLLGPGTFGPARS